MVTVPSLTLAFAWPIVSFVGFFTSKSKSVRNETSLGIVKTTLSPSLMGIESGILISLYSTLKLTYLPVPFPVSPFSKCMSTSGFLTEIVVPSLVISVAALSIVGVSSVATVSGEVLALFSAFVSLETTVSAVGADGVVVSSAYTLGAIIISNAAVKITPQRP